MRYQPKGVVGVISPWNYPLTLAVSDAVAALLAGNAVVIKPDSQTPYCALFPPPNCSTRLACRVSCLRSCPGRAASSGREIVAQTDYVMFTGSSATGSAPGRAGRAAPHRLLRRVGREEPADHHRGRQPRPGGAGWRAPATPTPGSCASRSSGSTSRSRSPTSSPRASWHTSMR